MDNLISGKHLLKVLDERDSEDHPLPSGITLEGGEWRVNGKPVDPLADYEAINTANSRKGAASFDGCGDWSVSGPVSG